MTKAQIDALATVLNLACEHGDHMPERWEDETGADCEGLTYDADERNALDVIGVMLQTARNDASREASSEDAERKYCERTPASNG
mgnify:CR=1 FL=1|tara:strand:+ start:983 stop:1237 length:255 start_codon:yes stop_codon:yes gene_type:complete